MARTSANQRREDLIRAAVHVVATDGVEKATTRRIAAEAQAPLAALHYCFRSKEALFFAIFEKQVQILLQEFRQVRKNAGLGRTGATLLRQLMDWYQSDDDYARASPELLFWVMRQDPQLSERSYQIHLDALAESLRAGMKDVDDDNLVLPLARKIAALTDGLLIQWLTFHDRKALLVDIDLAAESIELLAVTYQAVDR
jgi:AcrR family transcriptional regulator